MARKGLVTPDANLDARGGNHLICQRSNLALGQRCRIASQIRAQTLALRHVEHGKALQERHRPGFFATVASTLFFSFWGEAVGIDHSDALLALAHVAACFKSLPKG
jgi:hypothetical protein